MGVLSCFLPASILLPTCYRRATLVIVQAVVADITVTYVLPTAVYVRCDTFYRGKVGYIMGMKAIHSGRKKPSDNLLSLGKRLCA